MGNTLLTISMITNAGLPVLANNTILTDKFNRTYNDEFAKKDFKIGATVNVRRPPRYFGTFGPALNVEPSTESYVPVSILYQFHVDVQFNTVNMSLDIDDFKERFLEPACAAIGNRIDSDGAYFAAQNTALYGGTAGVKPTSYKTFSDGRAYLVYEGMPRKSELVTVVDPLAMSAMTDSLKGLFNPQIKLSENYKEGLIAEKTAGSDWYEDQNIATLTLSTSNGTPVLAGATATTGGTAILTTGWAQNGFFYSSGWTGTTASLTVGDIVQIKGVYPVNPQNRSQYGSALKTFVVIPPFGYAPMSGAAIPGGPQFNSGTLTGQTNNGTFNATTGVYTSSSGGFLTFAVSECLISGGQFQNCTAAPVSPYTITVNGGLAAATASAQGLTFEKNAFALAFVDLPLPRTAVEASRAFDEKLGMSMRIATQYTINNDAEPTRIDVAYGFGSLYRQLAYRVWC